MDVEMAPSKASMVTAGALHAIVTALSLNESLLVFSRKKGEGVYFIIDTRRGVVERLNPFWWRKVPPVVP